MISRIDYINEAANKLEQFTGHPVEVDISIDEFDGILIIKGIQFVILAKPEIRSSNKGILLSRAMDLKNSTAAPIILLSRYIATEAAREMRNEKINYLDTAGNCFLDQRGLFIFITGQKSVRPLKTYRARAFQESGIRLIFSFLSDPSSLRLSYRNMAEKCGISIGSVSNLMAELEDLNFLLKKGDQRILKNSKQLLDRWITAYFDVLRPRLIKKMMRFSGSNIVWSDISLHSVDGITLWGGEPAAAITTGNLNPGIFTIYTNKSWIEVAKLLKLIPDEHGNVEILNIFWNDRDSVKKNLAPALIIYADLIGSGIERNIRIANDIFKNELQHIK